MRRVSGQVPPRTQFLSYTDIKSALNCIGVDFLYLLMSVGHRVDVLILSYGGMEQCLTQSHLCSSAHLLRLPTSQR